VQKFNQLLSFFSQVKKKRVERISFITSLLSLLNKKKEETSLWGQLAHGRDQQPFGAVPNVAAESLCVYVTTIGKRVGMANAKERKQVPL
jgi:hypothetical protein